MTNRIITTFSLEPEAFEMLEIKRGRMNRSAYLNSILKKLDKNETQE